MESVLSSMNVLAERLESGSIVQYSVHVVQVHRQVHKHSYGNRHERHIPIVPLHACRQAFSGSLRMESLLNITITHNDCEDRPSAGDSASADQQQCPPVSMVTHDMPLLLVWSYSTISDLICPYKIMGCGMHSGHSLFVPNTRLCRFTCKRDGVRCRFTTN